MLYEKQNFYLENKKAYGFIKDFKDSKYSFIGILPKEEGNFTLSSLNIESLLKNKVYNNTTISIPKFTIQYNTNLTNLYNEIGIDVGNILHSLTSKRVNAQKTVPIHIGMFDELTTEEFDCENKVIAEIYKEIEL